MPGDAQGVGIPLALFGGMCTELSPAVCPDGVSPDCQDVVFLPGSVASRPCLKKLFASAFPNNPTVIYEKTFVQPNEDALNLFIDSVNRFWTEDTATPGTATAFTTLPYAAGSIVQALSCTQFGREYIACSDGFHGAAVPLQFDGTHLDRVTQDGPGAPVQAADYVVSYTIAAVGVPGAQMASSSITIVAISEVGFVCTVSIALANAIRGLQVGDPIKIAGVTTTGYNGTFTVSQIQRTSTNFLISYVNTVSGLAADSTGTISTTLAKITTTTANTFAVGNLATISGVTTTGYDGTWQVRVVLSSTVFIVALASGSFNLANDGGGTAAIAGTISAGNHQLVCMFLTRQGYITKPSPISNWTSNGSVRVNVTQLPIGPSNVVARILAFTGAGGANFFYIPVQLSIPQSGSAPLIVQSTVVNDNTSTSVILDFSDNALFAATAIDVAGRNYFNQVVLSDCLGVFPYASRIFWWGERNKVQNLLNMGFEGGNIQNVLTPLGWTYETTGGTLVNGGAWSGGTAWQITGDGTANPIGRITQSVYQDSFGIAIAQPNTKYIFRCWCSQSGTNSGTLTADLYSAGGGGVLATASITLPNAASKQYVQANFSAATPAVIPSDTVLRVYETGLPNAATITLDELQLLPAVQPYRDTVFRVSYVNAPEQMDGVTGVLGSTSDSSPIQNCFQLRNTLYFHTINGLNSTTDNATGEPSTWSVPEITQAVGSRSVHGTDAGKVGSGESGEQIQFSANENGLYLFSGGETFKISQEIQSAAANGMPGWDSINKSAIQTLWVKNDITNRRVYVGAPTGTATAPNVLFVLDYRELNDFAMIANNAPYRQSLSGRLIAVEFCRKWTRWNIAANCGEILNRGGGVTTFCVGAGNGQAPGAANGFGNVYQFDATKLTDDDYGQVVPYYTTYFFVTRDQEQQLGLDYHRKLATYLSTFVTGTGQTSVSPLSDTLANAYTALANYPLSNTQNHDFEWNINVDGERIALKIGSIPATGQTDNAFNLQRLALTLKKHPWSPIRGLI